MVFSSIHADQIDLARTAAVGAAHLKYFLNYAEKGVRIRHKNASETASGGLAGEIAGFLAGNGYDAERNFGNSEFRIDLAVRHPDRPEQFLLAVECDGSSYAAQRTTRDREHLRPSVLQSLGWHIYRAWSVDWAFARGHARDDLIKYLEELRNAPEEPEPDSEPEPPAQPEAQTVRPDATEAEADNQAEPAPSVPAVSPNRSEYLCWRSEQTLDPDLFHTPETRALIRRQFLEIVRTEGPVCESVMRKRLTKAWGFARAGGSISAVLKECLPTKCVTTSNADETVYWPKDVDPGEYRGYRVAADKDGKRAIDEIPPEELANAMYEVLVDFASCDRDVLFRETIRLFGLNTLTAKARQYLGYAFDVLTKSGRV